MTKHKYTFHDIMRKRLALVESVPPNGYVYNTDGVDKVSELEFATYISNNISPEILEPLAKIDDSYFEDFANEIQDD